MKGSFCVVGALVLSVALGVILTGCPKGGDTAEAERKAQPIEQKTCPITGNPINEAHYFNYNGFYIYFCSETCVDSFHADPEGTMNKVKEDLGITNETAEERFGR